jgi:hypothetical protein
VLPRQDLHAVARLSLPPRISTEITIGLGAERKR